MNLFMIRLNKLLNDSNKTMYKVAKDLKYSKSTISNWCNGEREPKVKDIIKLAIYFNVSSDYLLGLIDENGSKNTEIINSFNNNQNSTINVTIKK